MANKIFNFDEVKDQLEGNVGYRFDLCSPFDQAKKVGGLASSAHAFIGTGIKCQIVGFDKPAEDLFKKAKEWLEDSIFSNEIPRRYFKNATEGLRLADLSLVNWLLKGQNDQDSLEKACIYLNKYISEKPVKDKIEITSLLPIYLDAEKYSETIKKYIIVFGQKPDKVKNVSSDIDLVLLIATNAGEELTIGQQASIVENYFSKNINDWLVGGHFIYSVRWIKIVYSNLKENLRNPEMLREKICRFLSGNNGVQN